MLRTRVSLLVVATLVVGLPVSAQSGGAIYTSNSKGDVVNGNTYGSKSKVYLSGGPAANGNCTGGLADGLYYFQVTNTSGSQLLSSDPVADRQVQVSGGVIIGTGITGTHKVSKNSQNPCGIKPVALAPFDDSPNDGYKVWLTAVTDYDTGLSGFWGFSASASKTDNFRVKRGNASASIITGYKFYDHSEDGTWQTGNPLEVPIAGWRIELWQNGVLEDVDFTDTGGEYTFIRPQDGSIYTIVEVAPPPGFIPEVNARWLNITPVQGQVVADTDFVDGPSFGNVYFVVAVGAGRTKGFWSNQNGMAQLAQCEPLWRDVLNYYNGPLNPPTSLRNNLSSPDPLVSIFMVPEPPVSFTTAFATWGNYIVGNPAYGHAGFILSSQVAPTILNNNCGFMTGTIYIDRFQNGVLVSLEDMLVGTNGQQGALGLLRDPNAGMTGPQDPPFPAPPWVPGGITLRQAMLNCTNEFGSINETGNTENPQVVNEVSDGPATFMSPYGAVL